MNVCPATAQPTIQSGVNAAAAGDTISVCAGTFAEQVMVTKSVKLVGAGAAQTTIILPRPVTGSQDVVTVDGAGVDVEISGFTIKGLAPSAECAPLGTVYTLSGVYVRGGANAKIHDNVITGMRGDPLDGCQKGSGIRVGRAASSTAGTATITNNTITDYQKTGIIVDGPGSAATITGNTITGVGPTDVIAQNGLQISRGAAATVSGNRVSRNNYTTSAASTGMLLFDALGKVTVSGNTFSANDIGIAIAQVLPPPSEATAVRSNTISGGEFGISVSGPTTAVLIELNKISGAADTGIDVEAQAAGNLFRSNTTSGADPDEAGQFDCHDRSTGNRSEGTDNIWEGDTARWRSPPGSARPGRSPRGGGRRLAATGDRAAAVGAGRSRCAAATAGRTGCGGEGGRGDREDARQAAQLLRDQPGHPRAAEGRHRARVRPCSAGGRGQMVIKLNPQPKGEQLLERSFGGVLVDVRAVCRTAAGGTVNGVKGARAVLAIERVVTTPGS